METDISSYGIFQVKRHCAVGEMYHFKCYNNDENTSGEIKRRPYLLIEDAIGYAHKYKFARITSAYIKGESIPIVSNSNNRISFISLSSIIEMKYNSIKNNRSGLFYSREFVDMVKSILLYKYINAAIDSKYISYLVDYLYYYNKQVAEGAFNYDGSLPYIELSDIIDTDRVRCFKQCSDSTCLITKDILGKSDNKDCSDKSDNVKKETSIIKEDDKKKSKPVVCEDESVYTEDLKYIRECLDPDKENTNILSAFNAYKENKCDIKSLAASANISYDKAKYYIRFINDYPAIERSKAYRKKMKEREESLKIAEQASAEVDEVLKGCDYKINPPKKRHKRRRKRRQ